MREGSKRLIIESLLVNVVDTYILGKTRLVR